MDSYWGRLEAILTKHGWACSGISLELLSKPKCVPQLVQRGYMQSKSLAIHSKQRLSKNSHQVLKEIPKFTWRSVGSLSCQSARSSLCLHLLDPLSSQRRIIPVSQMVQSVLGNGLMPNSFTTRSCCNCPEMKIRSYLSLPEWTRPTMTWDTSMVSMEAMNSWGMPDSIPSGGKLKSPCVNTLEDSIANPRYKYGIMGGLEKLKFQRWRS